MKNKVRTFREAKGLTQRALAELVGSSQQQIQRIEAGVQSTKLDLVVKVCATLEQPLEAVFPALTKIKEAIKSSEQPLYKHRAEFSKVGIEVDPYLWTFRVRLRSGITLDYPIDSAHRHALWKTMQEDRDPSMQEWAIFDSEDRRIALNPAHVLFHQFLSELPASYWRERLPDAEFEKVRHTAERRGLKSELNQGPSEPLDPEQRPDHIKVYFVNHSVPVEFTIEMDWDSEKIDEFEDPEDANDIAAQMTQNLESLALGVKSEDLLHFEVDSGDDVFLRVGEVAVLEVLHWVIEPIRCGRYYSPEDAVDEGDELDDKGLDENEEVMGDIPPVKAAPVKVATEPDSLRPAPQHLNPSRRTRTRNGGGE